MLNAEGMVKCERCNRPIPGAKRGRRFCSPRCRIETKSADAREARELLRRARELKGEAA
jgi:endogenous inhibitor of DNA gyrase (YacG/DUF329 family)